MPMRVVALLAALVLAAPPAGRGADGPSLVELLASAGEYVRRYEESFRVVVAEEVYVQRRRASPGGVVQETRQLRSDVVFVRAPGTALPWWLLRDVFEVDGRAVRDRERRLEKLLVGGPADGLERAKAIADEGARFNLGRGFRNYNVPVLVLAFLHPSLQPRFSFERKGRDTIEGRRFVEIDFRELGAPTVIRGPDSHPDVPVSGRVWVHEGRDGTVGRTELVLEVPGDGFVTRATLTTQYRPYEPLSLWVPTEMRDRLQTDQVGRRGAATVEFVDGLAAYSAFRQAGVSTKEEFRLPVSGGR
jgi:ketosteroid isomerase-like protein